MAKQRNKFNVDEQLEQTFNIKQLGRAMVYVKRHAKSLTFGFALCCVSMLLDLITPIFTEQIADVAIPNKDISYAIILGLLYVATIVVMLIVDRGHALTFTRVSQVMITEIRHDMFVHLQKLPFDYFDSRPHGKILTRVVNYVNSVASFLSNGIISTLLQVVKLVAILFFMFRMHARLTLVVLIGVPLFAALMVVLKTPQRRAYQKLSNKGSNLNAYLQESLNGMKVTQIFTREEVNYGIFDKLCVTVEWSFDWALAKFLRSDDITSLNRGAIFDFSFSALKFDTLFISGIRGDLNDEMIAIFPKFN